jgi:hypothetical protein
VKLIESILINQLRIIWEGVKIPIWIQKNNCVVVTVGGLKMLCIFVEGFCRWKLSSVNFINIYCT